MVDERKDNPFFSEFHERQLRVNADLDRAKDELLARDPVFYQKTCFRAFLHLTKEECDDMSPDRFTDYCIMLKEVLKLLHAPFQKND